MSEHTRALIDAYNDAWNAQDLDASGATASLGAGSHPLDEAVSGNGQYLYNLTDGAHRISAFRIAENGSLSPAGTIAVPAGAAGLAAR